MFRTGHVDICEALYSAPGFVFCPSIIIDANLMDISCILKSNYFSLKKKSTHHRYVCVLWLHFCLIFTWRLQVKFSTLIQGDDESHIIWSSLVKDLVSLLFCILSAHFSVFCISPPVWFPLCGVPFIEIAVEVVCVWPPRAVIEPICRLAPVGLNPGLAALRWLNAFTMFLKPILFLFLAPPSSCHNPPNGSPCAKWILYWNWCSKFPLGL